MIKAVDHVIPSSILLSRFEKQVEALKASLKETPRWQWKKRKKLEGSISAYLYEINCLLEMTSKSQNYWKELRKEKE